MTGFNHLLPPEEPEKDFGLFPPRGEAIRDVPLVPPLQFNFETRRGLSNSTSSPPPSQNVAPRSFAQTPLPLTRDVTVIQSNQRLETVWVSAQRRGEARRVAKSVCQEREGKNKGMKDSRLFRVHAALSVSLRIPAGKNWLPSVRIRV